MKRGAVARGRGFPLPHPRNRQTRSTFVRPGSTGYRPPPGCLYGAIVAKSLKAGILVGVEEADEGILDSQCARVFGPQITARATKEGPDPLLAGCLRHNPRPILPGGIMANVLLMAALQFGYPVKLGVLMESSDATIHAW